MSKLDPYREQIAAALDSGTPLAHIADGLGIKRRTLTDYVRAGKHLQPAPIYASLVDKTNEVTQEEILKAQVAELQARVNKERKGEVADERILDAIKQAVANDPRLDVGYVDAPPATPGTHHRQAVLLSDWHAGEVVDPAQVGGLNEFNWDILERRINDVRDALLSFKAVRPPLSGLDIWFLGDMVSGDIHEELSVTNEFPIAEQSIKVGVLMARLVAELAPHYPELRVTCVSGNHARTKKPHASKQVFDSWDWVGYQHAAALTSGLENVTWTIPRAGTEVVQIAGMNWLLWHGDGVRSSMPGVPAGGVTRRANEFRKQFSQRGITLAGLACGHFHTANLWAGNVLINGSIIGTNEFGFKNFGGGEDPKQLLLTFDERKERITDVSFITPR